MIPIYALKLPKTRLIAPVALEWEMKFEIIGFGGRNLPNPIVSIFPLTRFLGEG